jgi:hypothetical protein
MPEHGCILFGHALAGVQHDDGHLADLDGLQGLEDAEFLDRFLDLGATAQAGGVDQR